LAGDEGSRYSRTPTRTNASQKPADIRPAEKSVSARGQPKTPSEPRDIAQEFAQGRRAAEYKYRSDDQLFATGVQFSPGKNRVAHNQTVGPQYYDEKIDPTVMANLANYAYGKYRFIDGIYGKDWMHNQVGLENRDANRQLAEQKAQNQANLAALDKNEDIVYLNNLAEIEERKAREDDMRREYRKQIDEYHLSLAKPGENKVEKAQRLREKIRLEAQAVEAQRQADALERRDRQGMYNQELGGQVGERHYRTDAERQLNAHLEANHRGLAVGAYKGGNKPELMAELRHQIEEKQAMKQN
jgi:hypothetical protein